MNRKTLFLAILAGFLVVGIWAVFFNKSKTSLVNPISILDKKVEPSDTLKEYSDPSGFSFNYPDNLSLTKNEDDTAYADLTLTSNDVSGNLTLKITDSKYKSLDEWVAKEKQASVEEPKEVKLGSLKAYEIKTADTRILGAYDQGIFFTIEMPLVEQEFWMKVYSKVTADFAFVAPEAATTESFSEVSFEGEEVVE